MKNTIAVLLAATFLAACAGMGGERAGGTSGATQRSAGEVIDDAAITARMNAQLAADPELSALKINVDTNQGLVRLRGEVKSIGLRRKAEEMARSIRGVKSVDNQLIITG